MGDNPWCTLVHAPTAVQLAIHGLPLHFLSQDEEELCRYIRQAILNDKATQVLSARYLNPSRDSRETKQATSVVITVDPHNVSALTSGVVILSQKRKVELAFLSSRTSQCKNCWRYGHAHQQCPAATPRAPFVRFTILVRLTGTRIQPAPGAGTISQCHPVVRPRPPIAVTAVVTTLPHSGNVRLDLRACPNQNQLAGPRPNRSRPHGFGG